MDDSRRLHERLAGAQPPLLLDVLPADAFAELHLPGAKNACVYEMTFLDQAAEAVPDRDREVVVYCSSEHSQASAEAVERLRAAGYPQVTRFAGGRAAWQAAGLPCEGTAADEPWRARPVATPADGEYRLDTEGSTLEWTGRNVGNRHWGSMRFSSGRVAVRDGLVAEAAFSIDMKSIAVGDLEGEMAQMLVAHLEAADFFLVERYPTADVTLTEVAPRPDANPGGANSDVTATLTLRGETHPLAFPATITPHPKGGLYLEGHFDFDRTHWGVAYGSGRLFERLGMHLVDDAISVQVRIVAVS